jgi:hypothetical protein
MDETGSQVFTPRRKTKTRDLPAQKTRTSAELDLRRDARQRAGVINGFLRQPLQTTPGDPQPLQIERIRMIAEVKLGGRWRGDASMSPISHVDIQNDPIAADHATWRMDQNDVAYATLGVKRTLHDERSQLAASVKYGSAMSP